MTMQKPLPAAEWQTLNNVDVLEGITSKHGIDNRIKHHTKLECDFLGKCVLETEALSDTQK